MSMFYSHVQKTPPQTPEDCLKSDRVSTDLWVLAEAIETWGKIIFIVLIILGIISTITITYIVYDRDETLAFTAFLISAVINGFSVLIEYCIYHILALYTGATASVVQNTKISADVALLQLTKGNAIQNTLDANKVDTVNTYPDVWSCLHCGTLNKNNYGQCKKCGKFRSS